MPVVILTEPFIRHYRGSVFQVSEATGVSGWDDDDRLRDRQSCFDKRVYDLPDNGKGIPCELSIEFTCVCPDHLLVGVDLKSGPCRVTSVSEGLKKNTDDPFYADPIPLGFGKIWYRDSLEFTKNVLSFDFNNDEQPDQAIIKNRVTNEVILIRFDYDNTVELCFDGFDPCFYEVSLMKSKHLLHQFTMIKCFPMVVETTEIRSTYKVSRTIW